MLMRGRRNDFYILLPAKTVQTIAADCLGIMELSAHLFGGFNNIFSFVKICRHCLVRYDQLKNIFLESHCRLQNEEQHLSHIQDV